MEFTARKDTELKPCPFCGGIGYVDKIKDVYPNYVVRCNSCRVRTRWHEKKMDAVDMWNRSPALENKPLTLEQLRQMDGEPVWVVHPNMKGWFEFNKEKGWYILEHFFGGGMGIKDSKMDTPLSKESSYGRDWLAYARKPEVE